MKTNTAAAPARPAVLLIEDDAETREAMTALLSNAGLSVIASDEGRKALELAGATRPGLVLLDLFTSGMNGWEFLERRGEEPALAGVPIVVVTGSAQEAPPDTAAVLRKPVDPAALLDTVRALLRRSADSSRA